MVGGPEKVKNARLAEIKKGTETAKIMLKDYAAKKSFPLCLETEVKNLTNFIINHYLRLTGYNVAETARMLNIERKSLSSHLIRNGVRRDKFTGN